MTTSSGFPFGPTHRRGFLKTGAALALGAGLQPGAGARAEGGFDWKRFKGEKIEVLLAKSPRSDVLQKYEKEFTELTGITVGSEQVPEQQQRQKAAIEFASGATSFDALMLALHVQKRLAAKGGWLADLKPLLADPTMTAPDFDFAGLLRGGADLGDAGRREDRHLPDQHRLPPGLLQQGPVPGGRPRLPADLRRDAGGREGADRSRQGPSSAGSAGA